MKGTFYGKFISYQRFSNWNYEFCKFVGRVFKANNIGGNGRQFSTLALSTLHELCMPTGLLPTGFNNFLFVFCHTVRDTVIDSTANAGTSKKHENRFFLITLKMFYIWALNFPHVYLSMLRKGQNQNFAKIWVKRQI